MNWPRKNFYQKLQHENFTGRNIDVRLKKYFPEAHEVYTVQDMDWKGITNGELLRLLSQNNFDCWIVVDKNIPYQQNCKPSLFNNCFKCSEKYFTSFGTFDPSNIGCFANGY